jgi:HD superfamily phosphodiesterase
MTKNKYKEIKRKAELLMRKTHDPMHDFSHIRRVEENAIKIARQLKLGKKIDQDLLRIACLFHDIVFTRRKASFSTWILEGKYSIEILRESDILSFLCKKEIALVEEAIRYHGLSFPLRRLNKNRSLYCQILQDADTLDLFHEDRIESLKKSRKKDGFFYHIMHAFHKPIVRWGRKNISLFLNFPQLTKRF